MLFGKDSFCKKNIGKYIIGYELGREYVQISFLKIGEKEPRTLSVIAGEEQYNIPFALYRQEDSNLWYVGKEAVMKHKQHGGVLLTDLLENACLEETTKVNKESYQSAALLALFIKRSFHYLTFVAPMEKIAGIMFVVENPIPQTIGVLKQMTEFLQMPHTKIMFMGKEESFFYYNLHTDAALWTNKVYLYEMQKNHLKSYCLSLNRQTKPVVTLVEKREYEEFPAFNFTEKLEEEKEIYDELFLKTITEDMEGEIVSAVYLIGEGFVGEWYRRSVRFLCTKRRVFLGNNLYSKGACLGFMDKMEETQLPHSYVYLGSDKLKANVGMELLRQGEVSYLAILDGGNSWYESRKEWDMILENENSFTIKITPLDGKNITQTQIVLHGLQKKKFPYCRIHTEVFMETPGRMKLKIWELGFGEFYASDKQYWEETIEI